jgi:hypothetical protein
VCNISVRRGQETLDFALPRMGKGKKLRSEVLISAMEDLHETLSMTLQMSGGTPHGTPVEGNGLVSRTRYSMIGADVSIYEVRGNAI